MAERVTGNPRLDPYEVVRRAKMAVDADGPDTKVGVYFSGGKDSLATLDLVMRWFRPNRVVPFYLYMVPGLSFQEYVLERTERRYGTKVIRLPHWALPDLLHCDWYTRGKTDPRGTPRQVVVTDLEAYVRKYHGAEWFAVGYKRRDSLERQGQLHACGDVDLKARRFYPVSWWSQKYVWTYLREHGIAVPAEYGEMNVGYGGMLHGPYLAKIRDRWPEDYAKILARFPGAAAEVARHEMHGDPGDRTHRRAK